jgi:hypothetical protein
MLQGGTTLGRALIDNVLRRNRTRKRKVLTRRYLFSLSESISGFWGGDNSHSSSIHSPRVDIALNFSTYNRRPSTIDTNPLMLYL